MESHPGVIADLAKLRSQLRARSSTHSRVMTLNPVRPILDILLDWVVVLVAVQVVVKLGLWFGPVAIIVIANRQRALGNALHDAGHRNLWRDTLRNDLLARLVLAPLLFLSLSAYRDAHYRHHLALGDAERDPDRLPIPRRAPRHWMASFGRTLLSWRLWLGSLCGHLLSQDVRLGSKLYIVVWWAVALTLSVRFAGHEFVAAFVLLWLLARATVFQMITTFREMCDHFGLHPGGIFSFTRDMHCHGFWRNLIHPRNNGYHLTHHLLPAVPYYRLPQAQRLLQDMPAYEAQAIVCNSYFSGEHAVTRAWQAEVSR